MNCSDSFRAHTLNVFIAKELTDGQFSYASVISAALKVELHRLTPATSPTVSYLSSKSFQLKVGVSSPENIIIRL